MPENVVEAPKEPPPPENTPLVVHTHDRVEFRNKGYDHTLSSDRSSDELSWSCTPMRRGDDGSLDYLSRLHSRVSVTMTREQWAAIIPHIQAWLAHRPLAETLP